MPELSAEAEAIIANMSEGEVDLLLARTRPPGVEEVDPKARAVAALHAHRGTNRRTKATPEQAADAFRRAATGRD